MEDVQMSKPISKYPYKIQHLGYPTTRTIQAHEWKDLSFHTSKIAAFKALRKYREHLNLYQWDDHYKIVDRKTGEVARLTDKERWG